MTIKNALSAFILMVACVFSTATRAQQTQSQDTKYYTDTVRMTLPEVEQRFVDHSLAILVAKYDVDVAKAGVMQAKLWYNPNIFYSQTLYNSTTHKFLDANPPSGNYDVQLSQLFSIAGKHTNAVKLAKIDAERAQYTFNEVVRSLKLELYTNYSTLYVSEQKMKILDSQVENLNKLINVAQQAYKLGALAGNDVTRLKAEMNDLQNSSLAIENDLYDAQAVLKTLLNYDMPVFILAAGYEYKKELALPAMAEVMNAAIQNRSDVLLADKSVEYNKTNLALQRSSAVPDVTLGTEFDRAGNASPDFYGINVGIGLPVFNRNQGQIAIAKAQTKQAEENKNLALNGMQNQVEASYVKLVNNKQQLDKLPSDYPDELESLIASAIKNYNKRYISILEFLDLVRTYTSAKLSLIDLNSNYFNTIQNLNYYIGTQLIK